MSTIMTQPYDRIFNFSAGPCTLPVEVLEEARDQFMNYKGVGMNVMEMSHRSKAYQQIIDETEADLRKLMGVPEGYKILFLQGGASLQFSMIPLNFLKEGQVADYVVTGSWGKKALEAAALVGQTNKVYDAKATNYNTCPDLTKLSYSPNQAYVHFTSNETIQGVDFLHDPELSGRVICDMSSDILSRPLDVTKYDLIYAGAQKNMGPAGVVVVVIKEDMFDLQPEKQHPMLDYKLQAENGSMYNTPPTYGIYICGLVYKYLLKNGGLEAQLKKNEEKATVIYEAIDSSGGFYKGHAEKQFRSLMNVTFTLPSDELTESFIKGSKEFKLDGLKGHRSVGGCRASIYNAFPKEGCVVLADYMKEFARKNG